MAKFMLITVGFEKPTSHIMDQWMNWFNSIEDKIENQVGLMNGKEVSKDGTINNLQMDLEALTGYLIINCEDMDEATQIAKNCPAITSTKVYEIREQ